MNLIKELINLNEEQATYTYKFRMSDQAVEMNPPRYVPKGVNVDDLTDDINMVGEEANEEFTKVLREYMLGDTPTTEAGIELLDAVVTKWYVEVYQYIKDSMLEDDMDIADLYDGDEEEAQKLRARTGNREPKEPTLGDAMEAGGMGFHYEVEFVVVSTHPLTQDQGQVIVDQVGGYAWGQYASASDGTTDWEMERVK